METFENVQFHQTNVYHPVCLFVGCKYTNCIGHSPEFGHLPKFSSRTLVLVVSLITNWNNMLATFYMTVFDT